MSELSLLDFRVLTGVIQEFPQPPEQLGASIFTKRTVGGLGAKWDEISNNRTKGFYRAVDGKAKLVANMGVKQRQADFGHITLKKRLGEQFLAYKRQPGTYETPYLQQAIRNELQDLDNMCERSSEYARWLALTTGKITINQDDLMFDVDFGIAGTHLLTVSNDWDSDDADVLGDLGTAKRLIQKDSGFIASDMYMNSFTADIMLQSSSVRDLLKNQYGKELVMGERPPQVSKINFNEYDAGYVDGSGNFQYYIPNYYVVIKCNAPDFAEEIVGDALIPMGESNVTLQPGKFAYTEVERDPVGLYLYAGINSLPIIKRKGGLVRLIVGS